jgi:hypothetical protein
MVEAGIKAWLAWEDSDDYSPKRLVASVYLAMKEHEDTVVD